MVQFSHVCPIVCTSEIWNSLPLFLLNLTFFQLHLEPGRVSASKNHATCSKCKARFRPPKALVFSSENDARLLQRSPTEAWVAFSSRLRWKYTKQYRKPSILADFRGHCDLLLDRLDNYCTWRQVDQVVRPFFDHTDPGSAFVVYGSFDQV